jgi:thioredoxin-related protein
VFFDEQGKIILRLNGYQPPAQFKLALRFVAERQETSTDYRTFVCLHAPPETGGALNSQPFFMAPPYDLRRGPGARPLAVFFEQIECPNCDRLHQQVLSDPEIRQMLGGFDVVQLDIWSTTPLQTPDARISTARDWARELHISYAPSIVLFSPVGEEVIRSEAWFKTFHAGSVLDYVLSGSYHSEPSFQRFISARANHFREQGIDVDI